MAMIAVKNQVWMATSKGNISVWSSAGPVLGVLSAAHEGRVHALISVGKSVMYDSIQLLPSIAVNWGFFLTCC